MTKLIKPTSLEILKNVRTILKPLQQLPVKCCKKALPMLNMPIYIKKIDRICIHIKLIFAV